MVTQVLYSYQATTSYNLHSCFRSTTIVLHLSLSFVVINFVVLSTSSRSYPFCIRVVVVFRYLTLLFFEVASSNPQSVTSLDLNHSLEPINNFVFVVDADNR